MLDCVDRVGDPGLLVKPPGQIPLVVTLGLVSAPLLGAVEVTEGSSPTSSDPGGSLHHDVPSSHSHVELIVLQAPAPVLVAHTIHLLEAGSGDEQNSTDEGWVIVLRVELIRGNVEGVGLRVFVVQCRVGGEKVNVMHCYVVTGGVGLSEPSVDQVGSVEPPDKCININTGDWSCSLPEFIRLVQNINLIVHVLICQEGVHVGRKLQELLKSITEWNQNTKFVTFFRHPVPLTSLA